MSSELDIKFPEIHYDGTKAEMYEYLKLDESSPFYGRTHADIFLFAMALAKKTKITRKKLEKPAKLPASAFSGQMRTFMRSIMIEECHDVYVLKDNGKMRHMCEEYANAGIDTLYRKIKNKPFEKGGEDVLAELIQS